MGLTPNGQPRSLLGARRLQPPGPARVRQAGLHLGEARTPDQPAGHPGSVRGVLPQGERCELVEEPRRERRVEATGNLRSRGLWALQDWRDDWKEVRASGERGSGVLHGTTPVQALTTLVCPFLAAGTLSATRSRAPTVTTTREAMADMVTCTARARERGKRDIGPAKRHLPGWQPGPA